MTVFVKILFISSMVSLIAVGQKKNKPKKNDGQPLKDSTLKYYQSKDYEKLKLFAEKWSQEVKQQSGENSAVYAKAMFYLGEAASKQFRVEEAELIFIKVLTLQRSAPNVDKKDLTSTLNELGFQYYFTGNFLKAKPIFEEALEINKTILNPNDLELAYSYYRSGLIYSELKEFKEAEINFLKALDIRKAVLGDQHMEVSKVMYRLGLLYEDVGDYAKAESYGTQALEMRIKLLGPTHEEVAPSLNALASIQSDLGNYAKAEELFLRGLEIEEKNHGPEHENLASTLNNLGVLYWEIGEYNKAEKSLTRSLHIMEKVIGPDHPDVARSLNNLGAIHEKLGDYVKAESYYSRAHEIFVATGGSENSDAAAALHNLGIIYRKQGLKAKAGQFFERALVIREKVLGNEHSDVAESYNMMGSHELDLGNYQKAENCLRKAIEIWKKIYGPDYYLLAYPFTSLGILCQEKNQLKEAERYLANASSIRRKALGSNHLDACESTILLGKNAFLTGDKANAKKIFLEGQSAILHNINRYFSILTDRQKEAFLAKIRADLDLLTSWSLDAGKSDPALLGEAFDVTLQTKGILLNSTGKWKHRIRASKDTAVQNLFNKWEVCQSRLARLFQSTDSTERSGLDSIQRKSEELEKQLASRSESFAMLADKKHLSWKNIRQTLKKDEAAIELIRIKTFGSLEPVTDTSDPNKPVYTTRKGLTATIHYAALIVKPESMYPELVLLTNGNDLEGKYYQYYKKAISKRIQDTRSYDLFWKKIGSRLPHAKKVYFSPDGIFHNLNLNTLYHPETRKYLLEEMDVRIVTVTKDILNQSLESGNTRVAELVGFPRFYQNNNAGQQEGSERSLLVTNGLTLESFGTLDELPSTKIEVDKIEAILKTNGWDVKNYSGSAALEENIKQSLKPGLLHVATHGFFQPDDSKGSNPLLRSGLMLAGAGNTLQGLKSETEDGILTAYEAMNLNLDNTDLVVLSACETGLGEIRNGEGVYGLQRAFKVAGAKTIIMSLWKVSDQATQELMVAFYKHWLSNRTDNLKLSVRGKRQAFLKAQKELKAKYPDPYYWGAFVVLGD